MKIFLKVLITFCFLQSSFALQISEVMYDPAGSDTGHEWVEVYNDESTAVDLKTLKFFESSTAHGISFVSGAELIPPEQYAIIADNPAFFLQDNIGFNGSIFDSSFSLSNSGEPLEIRTTSGASVFKITYIPQTESNGTGSTLSLQGLDLVKSKSTPGAVNDFNVASVPTSTNNSSTSITSNNSTTTTTNVSNSNTYTVTGRRTYILGELNILTNKDIYTTVGAATNFEIKRLDRRNQNLIGDTYWSYGDGVGGIGATTTHAYQNSGDFEAFVEVENSTTYGIDKILVHVRDPKLSIISTSTGVLITNHDDEDIDIGNFNIFCSTGIFKISRHLIITKQDSLFLNSKNMGFGCSDPRLRFSNDLVVPNFEVNKNVFATNSISPKFSTGTHYRVVYKPKQKVLARLEKSPIKQGEAKIEETVKTNSNVEKGVVTGVKKWLYWLYE